MVNASQQFFVYQRKDTKGWVIRYKDENTHKWRDHRCPPTITTKRQALAYGAAYLDELSKGPQPVLPDQDMGPTVNDLVKKWVELRKRDDELSESTLEADAGHLKRHIQPALGAMPVRNLTPKVIRAFIRDLKDKDVVPTTHPKKEGRNRSNVDARKLARSTIRNIAITLSVFLKDVEAEEWAGEDFDFRNPMKHEGVIRELPSKRPRDERVGVVVHLTIPQAERLIGCERIPEVRKVFYLLAFTSGARSGELSGLTWMDLSLDEDLPTATINKSVRNAKVGRTKTRSSIRTIPLHHLAVKALKAWKAGGWVELVGRHPSTTDPVFPGERGTFIGASRHAARTMRIDLVASGCPTKYAGINIDFHATRRSFSTWLDANGIPEPTIKRIMGHKPQGILQKHYTAGDLQAMHRAVESIVLDLTTGTIVVLPLKAVVGG